MVRLMCPPTYFDIEYSINPWMNVSNKVKPDVANWQWRNLVDQLRSQGDHVEYIEPIRGLPDMTFSGDAGIVFNNVYIPSNFRCKERAGEVLYYRRWLERKGYIVHALPPEIYFEGLGDIVFHENIAIVGYGPRSDHRVISYLKEIIPNLRILGDVRIIDDHYFHLAMALSFLDEDTILYYPPAFDQKSQECLRDIVKNPIAIGAEDANQYFACNNLVIGKTVLLDNCTDVLRSALYEKGYTVCVCPMSEFKKSGGSLRCLVLSFIVKP